MPTKPKSTKPAASAIARKPRAARATDVTGLADLLGNASSGTVNVTRKSALGWSPLWCGITQISGDIAQTPIYVYKRLGTGKERYPEHPAYRLLRRQANTYQKAFDWMRMAIAQALLMGNHYSWIIRDPISNIPLELLPMDPQSVQIVYDPQKESLLYKYTSKRTKGKALPAADVFHLRGLTWDGSEGMSLFDLCKNTIQRGLSIERFARKFFDNSATPSGVLSHPNTLTAKAAERLQAQFTNRFGGDNAFKVFVTEEGMQWNAMGVDAEKSQLLQSAEFSVREVARLLNIPSHRLGDTARTSYASLEQENRSYYETTLGPWFAQVREEAYAKLLTEEEQRMDQVVIEELQINILRADAAARSAFYHNAILDGYFNRDEVRGLENLNPMPNGLGQTYYVPTNMQSAETFLAGPDSASDDSPKAGSDDVAANAPDAARAAATLVLRDAWQRVVTRLSRDRARRKNDAAWRAELVKRHADPVVAILKPAFCVARDILREKLLPVELAVDSWLNVMAANTTFELPEEIDTFLEQCRAKST